MKVYRNLFPIVGALIFVLGLLLRFVLINSVPFTAREASLAWEALEASKGITSQSSPLSLYTGLTGFLFWIMHSSNFSARLLPILAGASMVLAPFFLLGGSKKKQALILSAFIAIDPIFIIFSRQIDSPIYAVAALTWLLIFIKNKRWILAGIAAGFSLLSGKYFWIISLIILIICLLLFTKKSNLVRRLKMFFLPLKFSYLLAAAAITVVLVSSSFMINPAGISGVLGSLPDIFRQPGNSPLPWYLPAFLLLSYSLFGFVFSLLELNKSDKFTGRVAFLTLAFLIIGSLVLYCVFPGVYLFVEFVLVWFAAKYFSELKFDCERIKGITAAAFVFFTALMIFIGLSFAQFAHRLQHDNIVFLDLLPMLLAFLLIVLSYMLICVGWGFETAKPALIFTFSLVLFVNMLSFSFSQYWHGNENVQLLFANSPVLYPDNLMENEIGSFVFNRAMIPESVSYRVEGPTANADAWFFRDFAVAQPSESEPDILISNETEPVVAETYRGSSFAYSRTANIKAEGILGLVKYYGTKKFPAQTINRVLWVKTSFFPGGQP